MGDAVVTGGDAIGDEDLNKAGTKECNGIGFEGVVLLDNKAGIDGIGKALVHLRMIKRDANDGEVEKVQGGRHGVGLAFRRGSFRWGNKGVAHNLSESDQDAGVTLASIECGS